MLPRRGLADALLCMCRASLYDAGMETWHWDEVRAFTSAAPASDRRAWALCHRATPLIVAAVRSALAGWPDDVRTAFDVEDVAAEVQIRLVADRATRAAPRDEPGSARAFLFTVLRNLARDRLRHHFQYIRRGTSLGKRRDDEGGDAIAEDRAIDVAVFTDPEGAIDAARQVALTRNALERGDGAARYRLAYRLEHEPSLVVRELVDAAAAEGLARSGEETWARLVAWRERHGAKPTTASSRREVAWILVAIDTAGVAPWRAADPAACAKAVDRVRQWRNRWKPTDGGRNAH
jgi:hypothetical protein